MRYNIKVGEKWLIGESATETIKGTVRGDTTAVFSRMVGEMSAYDFADNRQEAASFDRITLCDYLRGIVERQNYGYYLGEIKVIQEGQKENEIWLAERNECEGLRKRIKTAEAKLLFYKGEADLYKELYRTSHEAFLTELYRANEDKQSTKKIFLDGCGAKMEVQE